MPESPDFCPHCGSHVPPRSPSCPACGSDHETGWSDSATSQRLGIPDEDFDYDEFVRTEFNPDSRPPQLRPRGISWFWWSVAILLLALLGLLWF